MRILWRVLVALVLVAALVGIGVYAYNAGIAQGVAQNVGTVRATSLPPAGQTAPVTVPYWGYGFPFFGFGFGPFACLIPLFLFFLFFASLRALLWHGRMGPMGWGGMHRRHWGWRDEDSKDVPPFFAEMHRRVHSDPNWDKAPEEKQK